jgi:hypothetical protein
MLCRVSTVDDEHSDTLQHKIDDLQEDLSTCVYFGKAKAQCQRPSLVGGFGRDRTCDLRSIQMTDHLPVGTTGTKKTSGREA